MLFTLEKINQIIREHQQKGSTSPVIEYYHHLRISFIVDNQLISKHLSSFKDSIVEIEKRLYKNENIIYFEEQKNDFNIEDLNYQYHYDNEKYVREYKSFESLYKERIIAFENINTEGLFEKYIYILDFKGEIVVYNKPKKVTDFIFNNRIPENFPFHPMLVSDNSLCVKLAGEISLSKEKDFIIINNISGHYMPTDWKCVELVQLIKEQKNIFREPFKIIAFANDGVCVYGINYFV